MTVGANSRYCSLLTQSDLSYAEWIRIESLNDQIYTLAERSFKQANSLQIFVASLEQNPKISESMQITRRTFCVKCIEFAGISFGQFAENSGVSSKITQEIAEQGLNERERVALDGFYYHQASIGATVDQSIEIALKIAKGPFRCTAFYNILLNNSGMSEEVLMEKTEMFEQSDVKAGFYLFLAKKAINNNNS